MIPWGWIRGPDLPHNASRIDSQEGCRHSDLSLGNGFPAKDVNWAGFPYSDLTARELLEELDTGVVTSGTASTPHLNHLFFSLPNHRHSYTL